MLHLLGSGVKVSVGQFESRMLLAIYVDILTCIEIDTETTPCVFECCSMMIEVVIQVAVARGLECSDERMSCFLVVEHHVGIHKSFVAKCGDTKLCDSFIVGIEIDGVFLA